MFFNHWCSWYRIHISISHNFYSKYLPLIWITASIELVYKKRHVFIFNIWTILIAFKIVFVRIIPKNQYFKLIILNQVKLSYGIFLLQITFFLGTLVSEALNYILKQIICEARPLRRDEIFVEYGMPSSHAQFVWFFATYVIYFVFIK